MINDCLSNQANRSCNSVELEQDIQFFATKAEVTAIFTREIKLKLLEQAEGCGRCHLPGGCGGSNKISFINLFKNNDKEIILPSPEFAIKQGSIVALQISSNSLSRAAMLVYLFPLIFMLIGGFIGDFFNNILAICGAIIGFALAFTFIKYYSRKLSSQFIIIKEIAAENYLVNL